MALSKVNMQQIHAFFSRALAWSERQSFVQDMNLGWRFHFLTIMLLLNQYVWIFNYFLNTIFTGFIFQFHIFKAVPSMRKYNKIAHKALPYFFLYQLKVAKFLFSYLL